MHDTMDFKNKGNQFFSEGKNKEAIEQYSKGIEKMLTAGSSSSSLSAEDKKLLCILYSNKAQAHLKLDQFREAADSAAESLKIDPAWQKSVFRRITALFKLKAWKELCDYIENDESIMRPNNNNSSSFAHDVRECLAELIDDAPKEDAATETDQEGSRRAFALPAIMKSKNESFAKARVAFVEAIKKHDEGKIRSFLSHSDAKELFLEKNTEGFLPLHYACLSQVPKRLFQLLLDTAVEHNIIKNVLEEKTNFGATCLHVACARNLTADSLSLLLEYLSKHADFKKMLEEKTNEDATCLHYACANDFSTDSLRLLLDYLCEYADTKKVLEEKDNDGWTCLHFSCDEQLSPDSLRLLLEYLSKHVDIKKMLEGKDDDGRNCLHSACENDLSIVSLGLLLKSLSKHADIKKMLEEKTKKGATCLHFACANKLSVDSLRLLLDCLSKHADIRKIFEEKDNDSSTCLHLACEKNLPFDPLRVLLEYLSEHADIKKVLQEQDEDGLTCLHRGCDKNVSAASLNLLLEYLSKHTDINKVLEEKNNDGWNCLHYACARNLSPNSLRLLLDHLSKHADIEKMLKEKTTEGATCLHAACARALSTDSLRLLISFFPSSESLQLVLGSRDCLNKTPPDRAETDEYKQLLQDPNCWRKCRYWFFCNYQDTFLNSLYPDSPEKTLEALKELNKSYTDDETVKKVIANSQPLLLRDDRERQELEKLIFDRLPITDPNKEAISILFQNAITVETFCLMSENHLREMGVPMGPRLHFLQVIEQEKSLRQQALTGRSDLSDNHQSISARQDSDSAVVPRLNFSSLQQTAGVPPISKPSGDHDEVRSFDPTESEVVTENESWKSGPNTKS